MSLFELLGGLSIVVILVMVQKTDPNNSLGGDLKRGARTVIDMSPF
jgi:hypothetical protein